MLIYETSEALLKVCVRDSGRCKILIKGHCFIGEINVINFEELKLDSLILKGVDKAGFERPSPIQEQAIGPLLKGQDVIGQAKTGTGKTAAYALPLLQAVDVKSRLVQALVLAPTRELAVQITNEIRRLGVYTGIKVVTIYGGQSINVQFEALNHGVHAVVGTPGRLIDHIKRGSLDLDSVKFVILDEADTMLDMGFIDDIEYILGRVPARRQTGLFSATMPSRIIELSRKFMKNPQKILIDSDEPSVETLDQYYAVVDPREKLHFLAGLLEREKPASAMIFCRTKYGAHRLAGELRARNYPAVPLHGNLSQHQRDHSMNTFRSGNVDILVATDVASRGIDIPQVECVVNYDVPTDPLIYFHRVGRTARAGKRGKSYILVTTDEYDDFTRVLHHTKAPIKPLRDSDKQFGFEARRNSGSYGGGYWATRPRNSFYRRGRIHR